MNEQRKKINSKKIEVVVNYNPSDFTSEDIIFIEKKLDEFVVALDNVC